MPPRFTSYPGAPHAALRAEAYTKQRAVNFAVTISVIRTVLMPVIAYQRQFI